MSLDFLAGCIGGAAGVLVGHPLDTVKVNLQTQNASTPKYRGAYHCLQFLLVKEGVKGVYRGVTSPVMGVAALNAVVFGVYANVQKHSSNPDSLKSHAIAGAAAGLLTSFISSPTEMVKSRLQVCGAQAGKNPLDCLLKAYSQQKVRGVFNGLGMTIAREVPAFSMYFVTYELLAKTKDGNVASAAQILFAGGMAGVISWLIPYPFDVIKSKIQVDGVISPKNYSGYYDCLKKTVSAEGYGSLYRGMTPTLLRAFPVNAVTFFVVTWTMRIAEMEFQMPENPFKSLNINRYVTVEETQLTL